MNAIKPQWIGLFVSSGFVVLIALIIGFGGGAWRSDSLHFVLFFDQSVNGLNTGSAVKFRGVPVGSVDRIALRVDGQKSDSRAVPVIIKIDRRRLEQNLGVGDEFLGEGGFRQTIARGLAGRLNMESFITGQLFIELDFLDRPNLAFHLDEEASDFLEIPTVRSPFDELTADIVELIGEFEDIDLGRLGANLDRLLVSGANAIEKSDVPKLIGEATRFVEHLNELFEDEEIGEVVTAIGVASSAIAELAGEAEKALRSLGEEGLPLGDDLAGLAREWSQAAGAVSDFTRQLSRMLGEDSDFRFETSESLREIGQAARSLRRFIDYLERNPRALLTGRGSSDDWPEE